MALKDIDHIIFVMLENRSFDHMLGYLSLDETAGPIAVDGLRSGKAWRDSFANSGDGTLYRVNRLSPTRKEKVDDPPHNKAAIRAQIDTAPAGPGPMRMGGFVQSYIDSRTKAVDAKTGKPKPKPKPKRPGDVMGYYDAEGVPAFDFLARHFCVCDRWFTPLPLGTQANRLMAMGGESSIVDNKGIGKFPDQTLVYSWLDDRKIPWRVYTWGGFVPFFTLMKRYRGRIALSMLLGDGEFRGYSRLVKHWQDNSKPFPSVAFIEPEYSDGPGSRANDDHPPTGVAGGQALLADIYNILISNPVRWAKTLLIVTYDEHGGFFDHVPPVSLAATAGGEPFTTTGPRVPALLVSPQVGQGQIYSEPLDHTSVLQLLCDRFAGGAPYSQAVSDRQKVLTGRIAGALQPARAGPWPPLEVTGTKAFKSAVRAQLAGKAQPGAPSTPNGVALDRAVRELFQEHPDLALHPDLGEMAAYVATTNPPKLEVADHIES
ncbi:MAG TPA: alkaline phosphatase family protein [Allosphingosinicella sp.]|nr:alkaline phosphatase family protein [Allosphingosinicella sp.]